MKGFVKSFLEAVNSRKDLKSVVDEKYFEGIPTSFSDAGTKCPSAFFMFDHQDEDEEDIKKTFHDHHLPTSYDDSIYSNVEQAKKPVVRKGWKPQVQSKENKYKAFIDSIASRDNGTDYSALCRVFNSSVTSPVTLGKLIQTVDGKITSSISDNKNPFFSRLMAIAIATKCVALEKKDDTLMEQANGIESFLSYAIYATIPNNIGKKFDEIKDSTIKLVQEILPVSGKDKIKSYFKTLNLLDQIHTTIRDESNWNYRFLSKDPNNAFIDFDENGKIIPFKFYTKINIDFVAKKPYKIQEILDQIKTFPEDSSSAYSLIQKVACTITEQEYPKTEDDINKYKTINLESLSADDAQTVLLTTLNLLSTIEKDVEPSKQEDFDKLITTLVLPATEIDNTFTDQVKKNVVDKVKNLCTSDPEISAVPGVSDMFTPKAVLKYQRQPLSIALNWLEKAIKAKAEDQAEGLAFASSKDPNDEIKNSEYLQIHTIIHKTKNKFAKEVNKIDPNDPLVATKMTNDQFNNILDSLQVGRGKNKKVLNDNVKNVLRVGYNYCCQYAAQIYSLGTAYSKDAEKQLREQFNQGLEDTKDDKGNNIQGVASQMLDGLNS